MTITARHALANGFLHTSEAFDVRLTFVSGTSPVSATIPSGMYYMACCPDDENFIKVLRKRIQLALIAAGRTELVQVTLDERGVFYFLVTSSSGTHITTYTLTLGSWGRILGLLGGVAMTPTVAGFAPFDGFVSSAYGFSAGYAMNPVYYLALFSNATGNGWQPLQAGGIEQTVGGKVYGFAASNTTWTRTMKFRYIPSRRHFGETDTNVGEDDSISFTYATPLYPDREGYQDLAFPAVSTGDYQTTWSVLHSIYASRNGLPCCLLLDHWNDRAAGTAFTSLALPLTNIYIKNSLGTAVTPTREDWSTYVGIDLDLVWDGSVSPDEYTGTPLSLV